MTSPSIHRIGPELVLKRKRDTLCEAADQASAPSTEILDINGRRSRFARLAIGAFLLVRLPEC